ncbi:MAG: phosphatidylglycerol lysyltransferase domain-containing protein [Nitrospirales bacterium]
MMIAVEPNRTAHHAPIRSDLIQIIPLPQHVPNRVCLSCDVCCRFPEVNSFLRPYFTAHEIAEAISRGIDPEAFSDRQGSQIRVVPNPAEEGYVCSAFDAATSHCRIYEKRPLDCQIYPLAVMWSADGKEVVLGWDRKCPFLGTGSRFEVRGSGLESGTESIDQYGEKIAALIEREEMVETFVHNPRLIGRYQDDVVVVRPLPRVTARLRKQNDTSNLDPPSSNQPRASSLDPRTLRPLTPEDYSRFQEALVAADTPLAAYALAPHLIWRRLLTYYWSEREGHHFLFAQYTDGLFMPLPPLGTGLLNTSLKASLARAFAVMQERNRGSAVSRVENVPEEWKAQWEAWGYCLTPKDADYVYDARALAELRGDRYKSQRAACNRFARAHRFRYEPYEARDRARCLDLYRRWVMQKEARGVDAVGRMMLEDAAGAHDEALTVGHFLGLIGRVVWVDEMLVAYTFGYFRTSSLFCVLLEIADRSISGLASYLFREFCREACERGATLINTMDDSGLGKLRQSKQAYHPLRTVNSYIATGIF